MAGENFKEEYLLLLMKQYFNMPNARAEIELKVCEYEKLFCIIDQFPLEFDIHLATGDRLDKIGAIVGVGRVVCDVVDIICFGFDDNPTSRGFGCKDNPDAISAPFACKFTPEFTALELDDTAYRQIIKAKIAVNNTTAYITSCDRISLQEVIQTAFNNQAWVVDNYDMTLSLFVSPSFDEQYLRLINKLNLLPSPQGVGYNQIVQAEVNQTFGFDDNLCTVGFGDRFGDDSGFFATKVIL